MLELIVEGEEYYDEEKNEFIYPDTFVLHLEHSLVSLSKWESKYMKPFLTKSNKTNDDVLTYIYEMIITPNVTEDVVKQLKKEHLLKINAYIESKSTATWFPESKVTGNQEIITSELIYYWLIAYQIPFETEHWHLNRLFTLIRVCDAKNSKSKKMPEKQMISERNRLNAERRAKLNSNG